jgi:nucleotide-binding universal stress UspA family protein
VADRNRILVAVDFSETSEHALDHAADMARRLGDELHILHVYQLPTYALPQVMPLPTKELTDELVRAVTKSLDSMVDEHAADGLAVTGHLAEGVAYEVILEKASALDAELVVVGTHGRSGLGHALLGSTAEKLVRLSPIPVTTVRGARGRSALVPER